MKPPEPVRLFLDSGAYSAWGQGHIIDVREYIKFVREAEPWITTYANLDVIPGGSDRVRTTADAEASAAQSYRNLQIMKDAGLKPLPVFHHGERFHWLEQMLKDGENYIGVSTAKNLLDIVQRRWLGDFFREVTDQQGRPLIRVHGFGAAHVRLLRRYPFYSVDSAGWLQAGAYGKIYVPPYRDGKPDCLGDPEMITVSGRALRSRYAQARAFETLNARGLGHVVRRFLEQEVGINLGMARYSPAQRHSALATYYLRMSTAIKDLTFYFSSTYDADPCQILLATGARHHLLSYWELRKRKPGVLMDYVMYGKVGDGIKRRQPLEIDWSSRSYLERRGLALAKRMLQFREPEAEGEEISPAGEER
jgi:hypothetical protein